MVATSTHRPTSITGSDVDSMLDVSSDCEIVPAINDKKRKPLVSKLSSILSIKSTRSQEEQNAVEN